MYRLIYWSCSTIPLEEELLKLREILTEAMQFNQAHDITGVLYFGQGYFMQCLEGNQKDVEFIYEKIRLDPRHCTVTTMYTEQIEKRQFGRWQMSFVRQKSKELQFLKELGFNGFEPNGLTRNHLDQFLDFLLVQSSSKVKKVEISPS